MTTTPKLEARYGRQSSKLRPATLIFAGSLLVAFFGFAIYANFLGKPVASVEVTSYEPIDESHILGNYIARTGSQPASCVFKAFATRGKIVGYVEVEIPANNSDAKALQVVVKTLEPATVLRDGGCRVK